MNKLEQQREADLYEVQREASLGLHKRNYKHPFQAELNQRAKADKLIRNKIKKVIEHNIMVYGGKRKTKAKNKMFGGCDSCGCNCMHHESTGGYKQKKLTKKQMAEVKKMKKVMGSSMAYGLNSFTGGKRKTKQKKANNNAWILHVKDIARRKHISYADALKDPDTRNSYHGGVLVGGRNYDY